MDVHLTDPSLRPPRVEARALRHELGPTPADGLPLTSIIVRLTEDTFGLNNLYHLERVLGPGYEVILVVDDPAIWPEVYGRLLRRRGSMTIPLILLQCAEALGYAKTGNLGLMAARGDVIVIMSREILVAACAALENAIAAIRARSLEASALIIGLSLQDEEGRITPAGIEPWPSSAVSGLSESEMTRGYLPRVLDADGSTQPVPAVAGGLIALSAQLAKTLNGFSALYDNQVFEDADLCLRARRKGAQIIASDGLGLYRLKLSSGSVQKDPAVLTNSLVRDSIAFGRRWNGMLSEDRANLSTSTAQGRSTRSGVGVRKRNAHDGLSAKGTPRETRST